MMEYQDIWNNVRDELEKSLAPQSFQQTFGEVKKVVKHENGIIYVLTPSAYARRTINNIYYKNINEIVKKYSKENLRFKFVAEGEIKQDKKPVQIKQLAKTDLNPNNTFESFVVGDSNRMAVLTSLKVADNPGVVYNPLYIFGGVGLGKTHLMQAIGNYITEQNIETRILYVQANDYLSDYTRAIRDNNLAGFEEKYENIDVLLIDDIQMLTDKNQTQQQFFKLFNELDNNNKQIVITSDRPAAKLNGFMDRLTSRFEKGGVVDINHPDFNQRVNILKKKAQELSEKPVSDEIINYIAENFTDNVRELEGALNRIFLYSEMYSNVSLNLALAKEALDVLLKNKIVNPESNYDDVLSVIASMYSITVADILGSSRNAKYTLPRQIAMYILKTRYNLTYKKIGNILNGRDHTTILSGCTKISEDIKTNEELKMAVDAVLKKV
ncbi:MAG: chromosomal replication initiator protein DnaA [Acholeplasmatales bacterium]|nr:chromosomal replication initiator protein DnaA [Acholeplasmatales bacterium]